MAKPKIRFKGYTDDWEQRKLGDVFEQTLNLVNPKEDEIELWSLTVEDGLTKKSDRYNREFLVKKDDNFKEVRPGDIVYNPMNMTLGAVGYNGMAKSVAVSGYYTTMVAKENYDTYYINTWLKIPQAIRLYRTYATGSLIEKQRVQFPTLSIIPVTFPKYEEQIKIGSYFHSLDNLITLHQRKCEETKKIKKYMLQKMFPQNGQTVPEIRFAGFTDAWEQRKLGETCQITMGQSPDGSTYSDEPSDYILVQGNADLKDGWVFPRIWTTQKTKTAQAGDLIMSVRAPAGAMGKTACDVVLGRGVAGIKGNEFIYQTLVKHDADGYWKKLAAGSTFESINSDVVNNAVISLPQDVAEQEKIGAYFSNIDHLITLHQHKCEELQNMKKFMLQNMFV